MIKESAKEFDLQAEVLAFYREIVKKDEGLARERAALAKRLDDQRDSLRLSDDLVAIRWSAEESYAPPRQSFGPREGEYLYLVQEPLTAHIARGYVQPASLFAKVRAKWRLNYQEDKAKENGDHSLKDNRLELKFEGFVVVKLEESGS